MTRSARHSAVAVPPSKVIKPRRRATAAPSASPPALTISTASPSDWLHLFRNFINHLTIESKETGATLLGPNLWGSQRRVLDFVADGLDRGIRDFTILKSRQLGETSILLALDLFWMFLHPGIHGVLVIDEEGNRDKLRLILRSYAESLPSFMRYPKIDDNKTFMSFNVGGKLSVLDFLVAGKRKDTLGASRSYRFAHLSEVANYGDETGLENFLQTLSENNPDRLYFKESTANGFNHYHTMCEAAARDRYSQAFCFVGWWAREDQRIPSHDPRFEQYMQEPWGEEEVELRDEVAKYYGVAVDDEQLAWYRWRASTRSLNEGMLHQTQPWTERQAFVSTGRSFFPLRRVDKNLEEVYGGELEFNAYRYFLGETFDATVLQPVDTIEEAELKVWEDPLPWARYVIGCDPAYGRSDWNDSHAITVCRCYADRLVVVAEWGCTEPETFQVTWALAHLASVYEDCYVNIEVKGPGNAIMTELRRMKQVLQAGYMQGIVKAKGWENAVDGIKWYLYHRPDSPARGGYAYGISTTADIKIMVMNQLRDSYVTGLLDIRSARALEQMKHIEQDGAEIGPKAGGRNKDDFVFSLAFAHRAWLDWVRMDLVAEGYTWAKAQEDDQRRREATRPTMIGALVQNWFDTKDKEALERQENPDPWAREQGFR